MKAKGLFTWRCGDPGKVRYPTTVGSVNLSIQSHFIFLIVFTCELGYLTEEGYPVSRGGNPLRWGEFSSCEFWRWGRVMFIRAIISEFLVDIRSSRPRDSILNLTPAPWGCM